MFENTNWTVPRFVLFGRFRSSDRKGIFGHARLETSPCFSWRVDNLKLPSLVINSTDPAIDCCLRLLIMCLQGLWCQGLERLDLCFFSLDRLLRRHCPSLRQHLADEGVELSMFTSRWFVTLFTSTDVFGRGISRKVIGPPSSAKVDTSIDQHQRQQCVDFYVIYKYVSAVKPRISLKHVFASCV